ncbi:hypothetical protein, partial [Actinacidiphila rubida]|uniref:hypothetical protein n=1 Tax=Actinacidiphila rubida TaxID=310780 RepID=UPI00114D1D77
MPLWSVPISQLGPSHRPGDRVAMAALIRSVPAAELADRYPGHLVGTLGKAALPGPDSLIIVIGHHPDELAGRSDAVKVDAIATLSP